MRFHSACPCRSNGRGGLPGLVSIKVNFDAIDTLVLLCITSCSPVRVLEMQLLKACEIGAGLFGLMALFGALFAGFSWLAAIPIAIAVVVIILLICPVVREN